MAKAGPYSGEEKNIAERWFNPLSRMHERYGRQTNGRETVCANRRRDADGSRGLSVVRFAIT